MPSVIITVDASGDAYDEVVSECEQHGLKTTCRKKSERILEGDIPPEELDELYVIDDIEDIEVQEEK